MSPEEEEQFERTTFCWLCEESFGSSVDLETSCEQPVIVKVRDHDHIIGKYRGATHSKCNFFCKQKSSSFVPIFFHNFSGYDDHLIFEQLLTE